MPSPTSPASHCCPHTCTRTPRQRRLDAVVDLGGFLAVLALGVLLGCVLLTGHVCGDEVSMTWLVVRGDVVAMARWAWGSVVGVATATINTLKG